jgi:hypothetical protein
MLTAWYIGDNKKDDFLVRLGRWFIRLGQSSELYGNVTHCEAILSGHHKLARIASASLRDGGVRIKATDLNPEHWRVLSVPAWSRVKCEAWFAKNDGRDYSVIGAMSSASMLVRVALRVLRIEPSSLGEWCSRALALSVGVRGAEDMSVSELMAHAMSLEGTEDVTARFFSQAIELAEVRDPGEVLQVS